MIDQRELELDLKWWQEVGAVLDLVVYSFTDRKWARFRRRDVDHDNVEIPGWLAERVLSLAKRANNVLDFERPDTDNSQEVENECLASFKD